MTASDNGATVSLRVVAAAIQMPSGKVYTLEPPARHHNIIALAVREEGLRFLPGTAEQGFLLSDGRFARRRAAEFVAFKAGQVKGGKLIGSILTSEDLW